MGETLNIRAEALIARPPAEALALVDHDGRDWTYGALRQAIETRQKALAARGTGPGDRVLLVAENSAAYVVDLMAAMALGAWAVPVNARMTAAELDTIRAHAAPRVTAFTIAASPEAKAHAGRLGADGEGLLTQDAPRETTEGIAALVYTSGTTGAPKGVMLSHKSLCWNARTAAEMRNLTQADQLLLAIPGTHIMALATGLLAAFHAGASVRLMARFSLDACFDGLAQGASVLSVVPQVYRQLLARIEAGTPLIAPRLRQLGVGGAPLDPALKNRVEAVFGLPLHNGYGMTEAGPGITSTTQGPLRQDGSVGYPFRGLETQIHARDAQGVGELWVRGPGVMRGYYRAPEATAEALTPDGFLRTGDLVRRDPDGALHLVGRAKELIIRSGFNVYPVEVEAALLSCPGVLQAAVAGRPQGDNEEVLAFVTTDGRADPAAITDSLAERLAPYKRPQRLVLVEAMPMTAAGKIRKAELVAALTD